MIEFYNSDWLENCCGSSCKMDEGFLIAVSVTPQSASTSK